MTPRDHPRTRGVYAHEPTPVGDEAGSSPHTRGLPPLPARVCGGPGIIPAHAGFTLPGVSYALSTSDHPRTRGVYETPLGEYIHTSGSSPHTRGLQALVRRISAAQGIIPAHAGFTRSRPRRRGGGRDHPRTRGVYLTTAVSRSSTLGSSPHTRGLPDAPHVSRLTLLDHPRTRGVYWFPFSPAKRGPGSSPHTRGLRRDAHWPAQLPGIIPAHAGFTVCPYAIPYARGDHPRTRGVY